MERKAAEQRLSSIADLIDLERYPVHDLSSDGGCELVASCRASLNSTGACRLDGFVTVQAVERMTGEAGQLVDQAYRQDDVHNVYFEDIDPSLPDDDPRRLLQHSSQAAIAWDLTPADAVVRRLYEWDGLTEFIAAALEKDRLFKSADPLGACNITTYREGDELGWHFDRSEFSVTLMMQKAEEGGDFEYVPNLRSGQEENYPGVRRLLLGDRTEVIAMPSEPGTLAFFRGRHSIHRVTPVKGNRLRINAVLTYAENPNYKLNDYTQRLFYGRTA
jgi:hypothetical protein